MKVLLTIVGVLNAVFVLFHIYLGIQMWHWAGVPLPVRGLLETFNLCGSLMILFLAVCCLARMKEMRTTGLGAAVLSLGALVYLSRAVAEFVWLAGSPVITGICVVAGILHLAALTGVRIVRP